jgi:sec-independent protein translocase protein TatC
MALLTRPRRVAAQPTTVDDSRMSVIEHLQALRRALIISLGAWAVATVGAFVFWGHVYRFLIHQAGIQNAVFLGPADAFLLGLKIALFLGILIASPVIFQQGWWFVSPGLHNHEKRLVLPLVGATSLFFLMGVGFAIFSLPLFIKVLTGFAPQGLQFFPTGGELLDFVLTIALAFGIVFELPVVLWTLGMLRIISARWLYRRRAYFLIGLGLLANVMTPGADPITPLIVFIPLYGFFEGTALLLKLTGH